MKFLFFPVLLFLNSLPAIGQEQGSFETSKGLEYLAYFPHTYKQDNTAPLLLFLHGLGEKGDDIEKVKKYGPPQLINSGEWPKTLPFVVISPQLPTSYNSWPAPMVDELIEEMIKKYHLNNQKIYLTGISLGGMGTWQYALKHSDKLAAIIPISGKSYPYLACSLNNLPVWAFHGEQDEIVKPQGSIKMIEALNKCDNRKINITKFTLYPKVKHDSWTRTYKNLAIYEWLLQFENKNVDFEKTSNVLNPENTTPSKKLVHLKELCNLPIALTESSGLQTYNHGIIWTHNDSGNLPVIYKIDTAGKINQFKTITNATNFDWEDLAKDDKGNLYIGDFGNNNNERKSLQIYIVSNPNDVKEDRLKAEVISFTYSDQKAFPPSPSNMNFDVEAMIVFDHNIYLFSKNNTSPYSGYVKLYKLPVTPGKHEAKLIDSLFIDDNSMLENSITAADISPDQKKIVLLTYNNIWLLNNFEGDNFFNGDIVPIQLPTLTQKEGVSFKNNTEIYISDERFKNIIGGKLYVVSLSSYILE